LQRGEYVQHLNTYLTMDAIISLMELGHENLFAFGGHIVRHFFDNGG
jgi:hypothetical protein